jgi:MoaA/NifB/PqqE/SkfB family radical SAM enzyme
MKIINLKKNIDFLANNPFLFLKIIKNYILVLIGKKPLRSVELAITYKCQCNCKFCSITSYKKSDKQISLSEYKKVIDSCTDLGAIHFLITGGEPLIDKKFFEIAKYIKSKNLICTFVTNGILLNKKNVLKIKNSKIDLVEISLDSLKKEKHDSIRSFKGCYSLLMNGIRLLKENKIKILINFIVSKENLNELSEIVEFTKKEKINLNLGFISKVGKWKESDGALLEERDVSIIKKYLYFDHVRWCGNGCYLKKGCSAGIEKIYINPFGDVSPCPLIPIIFGNIKDTTIKDIRKKILSNQLFNKIHNRCLPSYKKELFKRF